MSLFKTISFAYKRNLLTELMKHKSTALVSSSVPDIRGIIFCQRSPIDSSHTMESFRDVQAAHISQANGNRSMGVDFDNCDSNESILDGLHQRRANPRLISPLTVPSASIVSESEITSPMVASEHSNDEQPLSGEFFANDAVKEFPQENSKPETISTAHLTLIDLESVFGERMNKVNLFYTFITILRTKATAAQNADALSDHIVRGLYFLAVVFVATIYDVRAVGTLM